MKKTKILFVLVILTIMLAVSMCTPNKDEKPEEDTPTPQPTHPLVGKWVLGDDVYVFNEDKTYTNHYEEKLIGDGTWSVEGDVLTLQFAHYWDYNEKKLLETDKKEPRIFFMNENEMVIIGGYLGGDPETLEGNWKMEDGKIDSTFDYDNDPSTPDGYYEKMSSAGYNLNKGGVAETWYKTVKIVKDENGNRIEDLCKETGKTLNGSWSVDNEGKLTISGTGMMDGTSFVYAVGKGIIMADVTWGFNTVEELVKTMVYTKQQ